MAMGWIWWRAWSPLVARDAAALYVAGAALGDINLRFAWQAWDLETSTFPSPGRRSGVALRDIHAASGFISLKYDFVTHNFVAHNLSHISLTCNFSLTNIFVTHNVVTHNFVTHNSFTHNFVTDNFVTHNFVTPNLLTHNFVTGNFVTRNSFTHNFVTHDFVSHTHTLAQKHLCELLMWNASHVHKQSSKT